ncbi:Regulator of G-protein signaling rgs-5 [Aphelenchoides bicaudatus]|nr:Regulator of G-protein signaling rgs-5 [Aphelenchoides bicaudatus]
MNIKQSIFSRFRKKDSLQQSSIEQQEQNEESTSTSGLLLSNEALPMVHEFDDLFNNSSAMMYFMKFLDESDKAHLLKFWTHVEGFKLCTNGIDRKNDALRIYKDYIAADSPYFIKLPVNIQNNVENLVVNSEPDSLNDVDCFDKAQKLVVNELKNRHFADFLVSPFYFMHKVEVYRGGFLQLTDILQDRPIMRIFADFMEAEGRLNLLEFLLAVENFHKETQNAEPSTILEQCMIVYKRFFQIEAPDSLNFDPTIRNEIEESISTKGVSPSLSTFERAKHAAYAILETRFVPSFAKSKALGEYVGLLASSIDMKVYERPGFISKSQTRESISSCSHSQQDETFPSALDDDRISICSSAYSSEPNRKAGSLAHIDVLGRYESLFDNSVCSDIQSGRSFKNMFNRYAKQSAVDETPQSYQEALRIIQGVHQMVNRSQSNEPGFSLNINRST